MGSSLSKLIDTGIGTFFFNIFSISNLDFKTKTFTKLLSLDGQMIILNYNNTGLSILELGHRTTTFQAVMDEAQALLKELMHLDADHEVMFLHGGASTQFMQVPMNLLDDKETAAYADTGVWSSKAIKEARLFGKAEMVCSGKESNYTIIPKDFAVPNDSKYFHITTNNTIYGSQWQKIPKTSVPLVADMSSDIFSRVDDFNAYDLIYAGAQKNMGPAGVNLLVVNKNILGKIKRPIPTIMDYRNHIKEGSMLNTPPVFAVYVCMLTLRWLKEMGGVAEVEKLNIEKTVIHTMMKTARIGSTDHTTMMDPAMATTSGMTLKE